MKESQNIEWKKSWRDEYIKWICGFANAAGGTLYIGKDNKGKVTGISDAGKNGVKSTIDPCQIKCYILQYVTST